MEGPGGPAGTGSHEWIQLDGAQVILSMIKRIRDKKAYISQCDAEKLELFFSERFLELADSTCQAGQREQSYRKFCALQEVSKQNSTPWNV